MTSARGPGRTYFVLCGTPGCVNRTQPRDAYFDMAGWPMSERELVDGETWVCFECRGLAFPVLHTGGNGRTDWVSWFVGGRAVHFLTKGATGQAIVARLAELEGEIRRCAAPGCDRPLSGRAGQRYCSKACTKRGERSVRDVRDPGRSGRSGLALPDEPVSETSGPQLSGTSRVVIADTATVPDRQCVNCGRDLTDKRKGAVVCGDTCRKALARRARQIAGQADLSDLLGIVDVDTGERL